MSVGKSGRLRCTNALKCNNIKAAVIIHFCKTMGILATNKLNAIIKILVDQGIISTVTDLYLLLPEDINLITQVQKHTMQKFLLAINKSKSSNLEQFLNALSINGIGKMTCKQIVVVIPTLEKLFKLMMKPPTEAAITCIGGKRLQAIRHYFVTHKVDLQYLIGIGLTKRLGETQNLQHIYKGWQKKEKSINTLYQFLFAKLTQSISGDTQFVSTIKKSLRDDIYDSLSKGQRKNIIAAINKSNRNHKTALLNLSKIVKHSLTFKNINSNKSPKFFASSIIHTAENVVRQSLESSNREGVIPHGSVSSK